jgi:hypothetical protein
VTINEVSTNTLMKGLEKREVAIMDVLAEGSGVWNEPNPNDSKKRVLLS